MVVVSCGSSSGRSTSGGGRSSMSSWSSDSLVVAKVMQE